MAERSWVWVASTETVRKGKLSVLACVETVAMVAIYWAIAWIWDTHLHLLVGVLVMPLMLFRSDESVALGLEWAERAEDALDDYIRRDIHALNLVAATALLFLLDAPFLLVSTLFLLASLLICFFKNDTAGPVMFLRGRIFVWVTTVIGAPSYLVGYSVILFFAPTMIRLAAPAVFLVRGVRQSTRNWRRIVLQTDVAVAPDPLPGSQGTDLFWSVDTIAVLAPREMFADVRIRENFELAILFRFLLRCFAYLPAVSVLALIFVPTYLFRWALKSTAWFYLPLLFLASPYDGQSRLVWMRSLPRTVLAWVRLVLSLVGVTVALAALIVDLPSALAVLQQAQGMDLPVVPLSLVLVLDWSNLHPWQYASLPTALLTILLFFRLDQLGRREQAGAVIPEEGWQLRSMVWADRVRSACALAWLALITPPTLRFFHCAGELPDWAAQGLAWFFAPGACVSG